MMPPFRKTYQIEPSGEPIAIPRINRAKSRRGFQHRMQTHVAKQGADKLITKEGRLMKTGLIGILLLGLIGCSGGKYYQSQPMDSQIGEDVYHYHNAVQLNLPATMFHATQSVNWMEYCKTKIEDPQTEAEHLYPFRDCAREDAYRLTTMGSVASQFVTPVITTAEMAGGMVGMGYFIGNGLKQSGTVVNQEGGGASAASNASAGAKSAASSKAGASAKSSSAPKITIKKH